MGNKPPAFQFYVKDWLSSLTVRAMSLAARGAYIDLLAFSWQSQPFATLPNDHEYLRRCVGTDKDEWASIWPQIEPCFEVEDGRLVNRRLQEEARKREEFIQKQQENGSRGGRPKKNPGLSAGLSQTEAKETPAVCSLQSSTSVKHVVVVDELKALVDQEQVDQNQPQDPVKYEAVVTWAKTVSKHWAGIEINPANYPQVEVSFDRYYAKVPAGKKPHELPPTQNSAACPHCQAGLDRRGCCLDSCAASLGQDCAHTYVPVTVDAVQRERCSECGDLKSLAFLIED